MGHVNTSSKPQDSGIRTQEFLQRPQQNLPKVYCIISKQNSNCGHYWNKDTASVFYIGYHGSIIRLELVVFAGFSLEYASGVQKFTVARRGLKIFQLSMATFEKRKENEHSQPLMTFTKLRYGLLCGLAYLFRNSRHSTILQQLFKSFQNGKRKKKYRLQHLSFAYGHPLHYSVRLLPA